MVGNKTKPGVVVVEVGAGLESWRVLKNLLEFELGLLCPCPPLSLLLGGSPGDTPGSEPPEEQSSEG